MQPENILRKTYRQVVSEALAVAEAWLPPMPVGEDERAEPIKTGRLTWQPAIAALSEIDTALDQLGAGIFAIQTDSDLTDEAKRTRTASLSSTTGEAVNERQSIVLQRIDTVIEGLRAASYPSRPEPQNAHQEARLAGIKADLQLVLSPIDEGYDVVKKLRGLLERAVGDGDELATWLLASSRWPEDYLASRREESFVAAWHQEVASTLDQSMPSKLKEVRLAYNGLSNGKEGLPSIQIAMASLLPQILKDLSEWTLRAERWAAGR